MTRYTPSQAAKALAVPLRQLRQWVDTGRMRYVQPTGEYGQRYVPESEVERWAGMLGTGTETSEGAQERVEVGEGQVRRSVYLIHARGTALFKIGYAKDIKSRLAVLQTGSPHVLDLLLCRPASNAIELEKALHDRLREKRTRGEWFDVPDSSDLADALAVWAAEEADYE